MKINRYLTFSLIALLGGLLFTADAMAQPRYRGSYRGGYSNYRPYRGYAYNRPSVNIRFGGIPYRYQQGYFYRPYGSAFRVSVPPIGIHVGVLPTGYRRMYIGPDPYYFYDGTYYRNLPSSDEYEVVAPPLGAVVASLPPGAKVTVIDGQKYYEDNGTFYQETITSGSQLQYTVVGTDGVLNTAGTALANDEPQVGDRFDTLPVDAKPVVIQGEKFYTSASGLYYKEVVDGDKVYYEVVGQ